MADLKLPNDNKTEEELLALANQEVAVAKPTTRNLTEVNTFIQAFKIREGEDKIESYMLYQLYLDWKKLQKKGKRKPVHRIKFLKDFALFFKRYKRKHLGNRMTNHYKLDKTCFNLFTKDDMQALFWKSRATLRKERVGLNDKGKKIKQKQSEEPQPEQKV